MGNEIRARFRIERPGFTLAVDLDLPGRGITALFGHSGSGKTTCLRAMAGLEKGKGTQGQRNRETTPGEKAGGEKAMGDYFSLGETVWQDDASDLFVPTHQRELGVVFQEASLFPHLSVRENMRFGQKRAGPAESGSGLASLDETAALLGIAHLLERAPALLSGGERQRVAIARALLARPRLLLMDEPLAALDLKRKQEILPYLERLHRELSIPIIYVSHSPDEVARLADHLVLLDAGRAVASGPLNDVLARIDLPAGFADDAGVVLELTVAEHEADDLTRLTFSGGRIFVSRRPEAIGSRLRCRIHARDVSLALAPVAQSSILNCVDAVVADLGPTDTPGHVLVRLDAAGHPLLARITRRSADRLGIRPGLPVTAQIKAVALLG